MCAVYVGLVESFERYFHLSSTLTCVHVYTHLRFFVHVCFGVSIYGYSDLYQRDIAIQQLCQRLTRAHLPTVAAASL